MLANRYRNILTLVALSLSLILVGCESSTDSDSEENNNGDPNQSTTFESGNIAPGESFSYTFEVEETVDYYCTIHTPDMTGEITVTSNTTNTERDTVIMNNDQFNPSALDVAPNTTVVWINDEGHDHNIRTESPSSDSDDEPSY